jgi:hypothetical protein
MTFLEMVDRNCHRGLWPIFWPNILVITFYIVREKSVRVFKHTSWSQIVGQLIGKIFATFSIQIVKGCRNVISSGLQLTAALRFFVGSYFGSLVDNLAASLETYGSTEEHI